MRRKGHRYRYRNRYTTLCMNYIIHTSSLSLFLSCNIKSVNDTTFNKSYITATCINGPTFVIIILK
jgi:hypothetical protein